MASRNQVLMYGLRIPSIENYIVVKRNRRDVTGFESTECNQYMFLTHVRIMLGRHDGMNSARTRASTALTGQAGLNHVLPVATAPKAPHPKHKICLTVSYASRRHYRRWTAEPNRLQLLYLAPYSADIRVITTPASHGDSHLFLIVQEGLVEMPTPMAHDHELVLFTCDTSRVSGGCVTMIPVPLVEIGETLVAVKY